VVLTDVLLRYRLHSRDVKVLSVVLGRLKKELSLSYNGGDLLYLGDDDLLRIPLCCLNHA